MDTKELINLSFKYRENAIFEVNPVGYFIPNGDIFAYSVFFEAPVQTLLLNATARVILLSFDGKRTLKEAFEYSYERFEGVSKEDFFYDFMKIVNRYERYKILLSKTDERYYDAIMENKKRAQNKYQLLLDEALY